MLLALLLLFVVIFIVFVLFVTQTPCVCGFAAEYQDLIDYTSTYILLPAATRRTSMYAYITACCCCVVCFVILLLLQLLLAESDVLHRVPDG